MTDPAGGEVILVISSEILLRSKVAPYLRDCGYTVVEAAGTDEAMTLLASGALRVDVILCDGHSPGDGNIFAFQAQVRAGFPGIALVMGGTVEKVADAAADLCSDAPVPPPFDPATLADLIRQSLARRSRNRQSRQQRDA